MDEIKKNGRGVKSEGIAPSSQPTLSSAAIRTLNSSITNNLKTINNDVTINLRKIEIRPNGGHLGRYTDIKLALIFRNRDFCILLNDMQNKISIQLDEIIGFRMAEFKEMEFQLLHNFKRTCFHNNVEIKADPTNGLMDGATSLLFIPTSATHLNSLTKIESAFFKYFTQQKLKSDKTNNNKNKILVTWIAFVEHGFVIVPQDITLNSLLQNIENRFEIKPNYDQISYKNGVGEMIAIRDEEDWRVAKWEANYEKKIGIELHLK
ncbi:4727_t:CDS:2 [Entrophospora sp. SA101]|nr:4727_t:CDS:2 [Entrophospora sp. SA101]CAJ0828786.1 19411_t:CDS:2 [Entrophospora sp. SA101]CAJ0897772.1 15528_t:CDS:2 [Entrophospora sp. SA101]